MKKYLFMLLLPLTAFSQGGERYLESSGRLLAQNRATSFGFYSGTSREQVRWDTMAVTGENYRFRALSYVWQQKYEQAAAWFEKTTALFPKEHGAAGEFYLEFLKDPSRALHHLDALDALTHGFDDVVNHNPVSYLRGLTFRYTNDHQKAIEQFSKAIDPLVDKHGAEWVNYRHFVSRAVSHIATNQPEKALADLDKANKNYGQSALVQYHRGRALQQLGRATEARTAFQDASFFFKAYRANHYEGAQEDEFNLLYEAQIDEALSDSKLQSK